MDVANLTSPFFKERKTVAEQGGQGPAPRLNSYAQSHDVPQDIINEIFAAIKEFFDQPNEEKMKAHIHKKVDLSVALSLSLRQNLTRSLATI